MFPFHFKWADSKPRFYENYRLSGIDYGPKFQTVEACYTSNQEAYVKTETTENTTPFFIHPSLLDGIFQGIGFDITDLEIITPVVPYCVDWVVPIKKVDQCCFAYFYGDTTNNRCCLKMQQTELNMQLKNFRGRPIRSKSAQDKSSQSSSTELFHRWMWSEQETWIPSLELSDIVCRLRSSHRQNPLFAVARWKSQLRSKFTSQLWQSIELTILVQSTNAMRVLLIVAKLASCLTLDCLLAYAKVVGVENDWQIAVTSFRNILRINVAQNKTKIVTSSKGNLLFISNKMCLTHHLDTSSHNFPSIPMFKYKVQCPVTKLMSDVHLTEAPRIKKIDKTTVVFARVTSVGVNFADILTAIGIKPGNCLGIEFAGQITFSNLSHYVPTLHIFGNYDDCLVSTIRITNLRHIAIKDRKVSEISMAAMPSVFLTNFNAFERRMAPLLSSLLDYQPYCKVDKQL